MDESKTQLIKYFIYLGKNHTISHVFVLVPYVDQKTETIYYPRVIRDDNDIEFMYSSIVENNVLYLCVRSNCSGPYCH